MFIDVVAGSLLLSVLVGVIAIVLILIDGFVMIIGTVDVGGGCVVVCV